MTSSQTAPAPPADSRHTALAAHALAVVLDLEADELRADSPLVDLGADAIARIQWADVVSSFASDQGSPVVVDDEAMRTATTLGELAAGLRTVDAR